ncbi:NUDIX domain-containing protein [Actinokineospora diospyrosa]|uniref:NUDIX domain-containing protein n=1 Tax=Actinokineospora diospyrosa TaxID=103728 RepID=A0ABT1IMK3_9PSEU|nr:NUDIX hydrolase [Actinokineospora diospyrosa]MCP2273899.1 NUDIX domain-containing protein [Actinokineospora diospyrosa]
MADLGEDEARFAYYAEGNARQARKRVAADLVIRDEVGRVLLVNPTYKDGWDLPGGMVESNEAPRGAAERELREELGLEVTAGRMLALDWVPPNGPWDDLLAFVFDGGELSAADVLGLRIRDPEISEFVFVSVAEATTMLGSILADRLLRAHAALSSTSLEYCEREAE